MDWFEQKRILKALKDRKVCHPWPKVTCHCLKAKKREFTELKKRSPACLPLRNAAVSKQLEMRN